MAEATESKKPKATESKKSVSGAPDLPAITLETLVQGAALLHRRDGEPPKGKYLLQKCGKPTSDAVEAAKVDPDVAAEWAIAEARRRSPNFVHAAIVAQQMI